MGNQKMYQGIVISTGGIWNERTYYSPDEKDEFCRDVSNGKINGKRVVANKWFDSPTEDFMVVYEFGENLVRLLEKGDELKRLN